MVSATAKRSPVPSSLFSSRNSPLNGFAGTAAFVALGILGGIVDLAICWELLNLGLPSKAVVAGIFIVFLTVGWISFSVAENIESFVLKSGVILVLYLPLVGMILTEVRILFWVTLIIMVALTVTTVLKEVESTNPWSKVLVSIYASWIVVGIIVTLGSARLFGYAESSSGLSQLHNLLDARYLITVLLVLCAFADAIFWAFEAGLPKIPQPPQIPPLTVEVLPDSPIALVSRPFLVFINLFVMIAQALVNLVWQLVGLVVTYLFRTAKHLAHQVHALVTNRTIFKAVGRVILTFLVVLVFTFLVRASAPDIVLYLTSSTSPFSMSGRILLAMVTIVLFVLTNVGSVLLLAWLWKPTSKTNKNLVDQAAHGGSIILVALALSSGMMYLLAKTHIMGLVGFDSIGILTLLLLLFLGSFFAYHIARLATGQMVKAEK